MSVVIWSLIYCIHIPKLNNIVPVHVYVVILLCDSLYMLYYRVESNVRRWFNCLWFFLIYICIPLEIQFTLMGLVKLISVYHHCKNILSVTSSPSDFLLVGNLSNLQRIKWKYPQSLLFSENNLIRWGVHVH